MTVLYLAHLDLEAFCLDREVLKAMRGLKDLMTDYVYNGIYLNARLAELSPLQCSFFLGPAVVTFGFVCALQASGTALSASTCAIAFSGGNQT
jgi:Arginosuccinate synthase